MEEAEAREILREELDELRQVTYGDLVERLLDKPQTHERTAPSGVVYQVELQAFWDDPAHENLRVCANIDDRGLRAFLPLSDGFLRAPDESSVGE